MKKTILLLLTLILLGSLGGCHGEETVTADGPQYWQSMPKLTYGVMESGKLEILPWYGARAEETSYYRMLETEKGFYLAYAGRYFYADKMDLNNWVVVCNKPDCNHMSDCDGFINSDSILMEDGRLLFESMIDCSSDLYSGKEAGPVLISADLDGTDRALERVEKQILLTTAGGISSRFSPGEWVVQRSQLQTDGTYWMQWFRITDAGVEEFHRIENLEEHEVGDALFFARNMLGIQGDRCYVDQSLDPTGNKVFRFEGDQLKWLDLSGLEVSGGYLSGNTVRIFRPNEGYYDVDLESRKEVLLAQPQLENSCATIVLPNCILEGTMLSMDSQKYRTLGMTHRLMLFDGETWREVALPGELQQAGSRECIFVHAVTSDSILIRYSSGTANTGGALLTFYRIDLTKENLALEFCGQIFDPRPEELQ